MMKRWQRLVWMIPVLVAAASGCGEEPDGSGLEAAEAFDPAMVEAGVRTVLADQVEAWNRGDIDAFMTGYWNDDRLRFASGGQVTYGWQATLERYHQRYPDRAAMGQLAFGEVDVKVLGPEWALAFGRWRLEREADRPGGLFTLLLERREDGWRIVHDHTSSGP